MVTYPYISDERNVHMGNVIKFKRKDNESNLDKNTGEKSDIMCKILRNLSGRKAEEILELYADAYSLPIDIEKIVKDMGIKIEDIDFTELEKKHELPIGCILGATIADGEDVIILNRKNSSRNRKRFTIAHEIAHCCLHTDSLMEQHVEFRRENSDADPKEHLANIFAGELLIPEKQLKGIYSQLLLPKLSTLVEIFKVSSSVMAARLDYLNLAYYKDLQISEG